MKITFYDIDGMAMPIRPAEQERDWMNRTPDQFAYRCLPLNIANSCGWEILTPHRFYAWWNGSSDKNGIVIGTEAPNHLRPLTHFGSGVLTFHPNVLIRTEPGVQLYVTGPVNEAKSGIAPLSGIIETDWAPYTFTMNWRFVEPRKVVWFEAGEPICTVFPIRVDMVEQCEPEMVSIRENPELEAQYRQWSQGRNQFNEGLHQEGSEAQRQRWQKAYFRGNQPDGSPAPSQHRTKLRLKALQLPKNAGNEGR